ncbi:MAG: hypothetical protein AAFY76_05000, partial [Cyanobacteria bacterium J06649_11]
MKKLTSWTPSSWKYILFNTSSKNTKSTVPTKVNAPKHVNWTKLFKYKYNIIKDQTTSSQIIAFTITNTNSSIIYIYFNRDAKFIIIEQIGDTNQKSQEQISRIILQRENFWIVKLKTLTPNGFNQEL